MKKCRKSIKGKDFPVKIFAYGSYGQHEDILESALYYLGRVGTPAEELNGTLNENYVYINLKKRQDFPEEIAFETPAFGTYKGGEIDFVVQTLDNPVRYAVEVKAGKHTGNTARKVLDRGKVDKILYLKGNTYGGVDGKTETVPIYMLEKLKF